MAAAFTVLREEFVSGGHRSGSARPIRTVTARTGAPCIKEPPRNHAMPFSYPADTSLAQDADPAHAFTLVRRPAVQYSARGT